MVFRAFALFLLSCPLRSAYPSEWRDPFPAHRVIGNVYLVGSVGLAAYLISTNRGHILINSNLKSSPALIRKSVETLGFRFEDIQILLISHSHWDHAAGSAEVKRLTKAKFMAMSLDIPEIEDGGRSNYKYESDPATHLKPAHVGHVL